MKDEVNLQQRSRFDIIASILQESSKVLDEELMMDRYSPTPSQFMRYNEFLVEVGLMTVSREGSLVLLETTEKGRRFLRDYQAIRSALEGNRKRNLAHQGSNLRHRRRD